MQNDYAFEEKREILSAYIDSTMHLGIAQSALMVQDSVTGCFKKLKCEGLRLKKRGVFWVFTKTKIKFFERPEWQSFVKTKSFPVLYSFYKTDLNTVVTDLEGKKLFIANQEGCLLDYKNREPVKLDFIPYVTGPFEKPEMPPTFKKCSTNAEYKFMFEQKIYSQMIDFSHHMNNIEYIKLALNTFTDYFLINCNPDELEIHYVEESLEAQTIKVFRAQENNVYYFKLMENDRLAVEMKLSFK